MLMSPMPDVTTVTRSDVETIAKAWWLLLVGGALSVIIGIVILEVDWTAKSLAMVIGIILIIRGIFDALTPPLDGAPRSWAVITGVLSIGVGILIMVWPNASLHVIAVIIGVWILFVGIIEIVGAVANHRTMPMWGVMLVAGIVTTAIGVWALRQPGMTLAVLIVLVGIWAIIVGTIEIIASFEMKRLPKDFDRMVSAAQ